MEPQVVVVTGTSSGFGELIARTLALHGHHVYASMRDVAGRNAPSAEAMTAWAQEHDARVEVIELDVADAASVQAGIDRVFERAGRIDVVVNNAGISAAGPIEAFDIEQMQALFDVNVFGPIRVDKAVLAHMRERRSGLLIHVSSTLGRVLPGLGGLYPASKWAVEGLAESLHYQLKPFGINVVILEPGSFPTPAITRGLVAADRDIVAAYASQSGPRRPRAVPEDYTPPDPQEVAAAVLALVEAPPADRPLRQVVGPIFTEGVAEYNAHYEQVRDRLAESLKRPDQTINWGPR
ncbi:MAG TPA: SDR family oxidoreductase [Dehalococcoidia bacterium]|nr:SDR family oxidoreductase [Dehalococcoidia bacterium]